MIHCNGVFLVQPRSIALLTMHLGSAGHCRYPWKNVVVQD